MQNNTLNDPHRDYNVLCTDIACHHKLASSHLTINEKSGSKIVAAQLQLFNTSESIIVQPIIHLSQMASG